MKKIHCRILLFDWDGTLIDSFWAKVRNAGRVFQDLLGLDPSDTERAYMQNSGIPRRDLFNRIARVAGGSDLDPEAYVRLSEAFSELNRSSIGPCRLFPDVPETLSHLRHSGFTLMVSSSTPMEEVLDVVERCGIRQSFAEVLGSGTGFEKGPGHIAFVRERYGVQSAQVCMIGDEPADIALARQSGALSVGRVGTRSRDELLSLGPDAVIEAISELPDLLLLEGRSKFQT